ncbi:F-box protein GID2-like [Wolffia australiana]
MKRRREEEEEDEEEGKMGIGEDLLFEVLKHVDPGTLARAACVSRQWRRTAEDERLWEAVCVRHSANLGCGAHQLRSVVLALGGFRRLHALYLRPLLLRPSSSSSLRSLPLDAVSGRSPPPFGKARWGKDEVHLSLCLYSIRYFNDEISRARG